MSLPRRRRLVHRFVRPVACSLLLAGGAGCTLFRNLGTGQHLDAPRERPTTDRSKNRRDMVVEVTTDVSGEVVSVKFIRSSGAEPVDTFVANSIRTNWPKVPSRVTEAELTYSMADGFSQPKMLSSHPAP